MQTNDRCEDKELGRIRPDDKRAPWDKPELICLGPINRVIAQSGKGDGSGDLFPGHTPPS